MGSLEIAPTEGGNNSQFPAGRTSLIHTLHRWALKITRLTQTTFVRTEDNGAEQRLLAIDPWSKTWVKRGQTLMINKNCPERDPW